MDYTNKVQLNCLASINNFAQFINSMHYFTCENLFQAISSENAIVRVFFIWN